MAVRNEMGSGTLRRTSKGIIRLAELLVDFTAYLTAELSVKFWSKCDEIDGGLYGQLRQILRRIFRRN